MTEDPALSVVSTEQSINYRSIRGIRLIVFFAGFDLNRTLFMIQSMVTSHLL